MISRSITIRPVYEDFVSIQCKKELLIDYFEKNKWLYIIGNEKASDEKVNHWQIGIFHTEHLPETHNLRRWIKKNILDMDQIALDIRNHKDARYLIGYCSKEGDYQSNMTEEKINKDYEYYQIMHEKIEKKQTVKCQGFFKDTMSVNQIFVEFLKFSEDSMKKLNVKSNERGVLQLIERLYKIFTIQNKNRIFYTTYQKINQEKLTSYIFQIIRGDKYYEDTLLDDLYDYREP